jgi:hypothetical protein
VFDIALVGPIDVQAPSTVAAAIIAIAAINLRFPSFALIAFLRRNGSSGHLAEAGDAAAACLQYTALRLPDSRARRRALDRPRFEVGPPRHLEYRGAVRCLQAPRPGNN